LLTLLKENCRNNSNETDEELAKKEAHELYFKKHQKTPKGVS